MSLVFANGVMYFYYFSTGSVLKRAVYTKFNDSNTTVTLLTDAPQIDTSSLMTAVVNAPVNGTSTITLYYMGADHKLKGYEDDLE